MLKKVLRFVVLCQIFTLLSCENRGGFGFLQVTSAGEGTYEIYRIANEAPLQFISEQVGQFNQDITLTPGSYLVLADCSSETVIIYPHKRQTLLAHRLQFSPPHLPGRHDGFSVQCNRSDKTRSRQHISNRLELNMLNGKHDLLVGMVPLRVDFASQTTEKPMTISHKLSSLQVESIGHQDQDRSYFVSPFDELTAVTKSQAFGQAEFLLPGNYVLEINGTKMQVSLKEGEERIVKPARLSVTTSHDVDLVEAVKIKGSPWLVEINGGHWLNFNETYPVLPGKILVGISNSTQSIEVELSEGTELELKARSVRVDLQCPVGERSCLGDKAVSLYRAEEPYPFVESLSNIPIIYLEEAAQILVGIEGSRDITYELGTKERDKRLAVGFLQLMPRPMYRLSQTTDFLRVETTNEPLAGNTLDINLEKPTLMPLVVGHYTLAHHFSISNLDGERRRLAQNFSIESGKICKLEIPVFFNEKKYMSWKKKTEETGL